MPCRPAVPAPRSGCIGPTARRSQPGRSATGRRPTARPGARPPSRGSSVDSAGGRSLPAAQARVGGPPEPDDGTTGGRADRVWRVVRCAHSRRSRVGQPPGLDMRRVTRPGGGSHGNLRGAARGRPGVGTGIGADSPLQHHTADRPRSHRCCPLRHPRRGGPARLRVGADTRRAGAFDPLVRRRNRDLRTVAAQRWTAAAADARPRIPL